MRSRGIVPPFLSSRYPVSIGCAISVLISTISPRFARCGIFIRTRAILVSLLGAGRQGHDDIGTVGPEAAVREPGDRHQPLRVGKANAGRDAPGPDEGRG